MDDLSASLLDLAILESEETSKDKDERNLFTLPDELLLEVLDHVPDGVSKYALRQTCSKFLHLIPRLDKKKIFQLRHTFNRCQGKLAKRRPLNATNKVHVFCGIYNQLCPQCDVFSTYRYLEDRWQCQVCRRELFVVSGMEALCLFLC